MGVSMKASPGMEGLGVPGMHGGSQGAVQPGLRWEPGHKSALIVWVRNGSDLDAPHWEPIDARRGSAG